MIISPAIAAGCLETVTGLREIAAAPTPLRLQIAATVDRLIEEIHGRPAAADLGAIRLASNFASLVGAQLAAVSKDRLDALTVSAKNIVGDAQDRHLVIIDDIISTGLP